MDDRFVGRAAAQAEIDSLLERARQGRPRPLAIFGAPGVGKTTLLDRLAAEADRLGFRRVVVRADRADAGVPFAALRLALDGMLQAERNPSVLPAAAELARTFSARPGPSRRSLVLDALRAVVEAWAFCGPVLVALDDLHLADPATASALLFLLRQLREQRVLVVLTTRDGPYLADEVDADVERFESAGALAVVRLGPLDEAGMADLVLERLGRAPAPALLQLLEARSGGIPFFAHELLGVLDAAGALTVVDGLLVATTAEPVLPRRVSTAVLHRVFQLGADARAVASAASVLGDVALGDLPLLADLAGLDRPRAEVGFDALVWARVLVPVERGYHFAHAIVREAVYGDLGPAARRRLHGEIARALCDAPAGERQRDIVEVAGHVRRAGDAPDPGAVSVLGRAGDATVGHAPGAAAGWYRDALARLGPAPEGSVGLQLRLSRALDLAQLHGQAMAVARRALASAEDGDADRARLAVAHGLFATGRLEEAGAALEELLARTASAPARPLLLSAHVHLASGRRAEATARLFEAVTAGLHSTADRLAADALELHLSCAAGDYAASAKLAAGLRSWLDELPDAIRPGPRLALCAADAVDLDPAAAVAAAEAVGEGGPLGGWFQAAAAWALYRLGRWDEALRAAERARSVVDVAGGSLASAALLGPAIAIAAERGEVGAAERVWQEAKAVPLPVFRSGVDTAASLLLRVRGDHVGAEAVLRVAAQRERADGVVGELALVLAHQVDAALERDDPGAARAANDELQACWQGEEGVALTMHCLLSRARFGDADAAQAAREHGTRHGLVVDAAQALALLGMRRAQADLLAEAYLELAEPGAVVRRRAIARELRRLGRRVPTPRRRVDGLRPVEADIVGLVTGGLSNRQIAERTGLSPKTIEVYLSRIYAKTGCRSRVELAVAFRDGQLDGDPLRPRPGPGPLEARRAWVSRGRARSRERAVRRGSARRSRWR